MSSHQDQVRFNSAVTSTNVALRKWAQIGYGTNAVNDPRLRAVARVIAQSLAEALRGTDSRART